MLGLAEGVAHVSYHGCSVFLLARSPHDREQLAAEVIRESHLHDRVQVLLDDQRWLVHKLRRGACVRCAGCGRLTDAPCRSNAHRGVQFCVMCAVAAPRVDVQQRFHPVGPMPHTEERAQ
jgi:hypothetical protein